MSDFLSRLVEKNGRGTSGQAAEGLRPRPLSRFEPGGSGLAEPGHSAPGRAGPGDARTGPEMAGPSMDGPDVTGEQPAAPAGSRVTRAPLAPAGEAKKVWEEAGPRTPAFSPGGSGSAADSGEARKVWEKGAPHIPALSPAGSRSAGGTTLNPGHTPWEHGDAEGTPLTPALNPAERGGSGGALLPPEGRRGRWGRPAFPQESGREELGETGEGRVFRRGAYGPIADRSPAIQPAIPPAPQTAPPTTGAGGGSNASSAPPAPIIQVSIGRLEVRASVPAKSAAPPARPPARPASLQEYLERKKGTR